MIEGHGDDLHRYPGIRHNFSSNVYDGGVGAGLVKYLQGQLGKISNYPSPNAEELAALVAKQWGLFPDQVLFTNGATEAFYLIAQWYARKSALVVVPSFSEYEDAAKAHGQDLSFVEAGSLATYPITQEIVYFGNPNNPDGSVRSLSEIAQLLYTNPSTLFMLDEAYIDFTMTTSSAIPLLADYDNLVIVHSLTKTFAIPGLRLGYVISRSENIQKLSQLKMPWSVNTLAIQAGTFILDRHEELLFDVVRLMKRVRTFQEQIAAVEWLEVVPSETHYFLVKLKKGKASQLKQDLATQKGLLIRDATNFRGLKGEYIRLAVQSGEANQELINALKGWSGV